MNNGLSPRLTSTATVRLSPAASISSRRCCAPFSKNSRWNFRIDFVTLTIVRWRCWIERMSYCAERRRSVTCSLASRLWPMAPR